VADLYSKVTLRPRSKLERILELIEPASAIPRCPRTGVVSELVLFYLLAGEATVDNTTRALKRLLAGAQTIDPSRLASVERSVIEDVCSEASVDAVVSALHAVGQAALDGLEEVCRRDPEEARRRLAQLPRVSPEHVDLILLSSGALSTVAPSLGARRVAARLGYPGSTYVALARALDAEIPEGDQAGVAWRAHHALAQHAKNFCHLAQPSCDKCVARSACSYVGEGQDPAARLSNPGT